jgi:hypothetical protein
VLAALHIAPWRASLSERISKIISVHGMFGKRTVQPRPGADGSGVGSESTGHALITTVVGNKLLSAVAFI